ncbi:hypothetical protein SLEP1_g50443 [Rubroshorea leprosula]|uniref:Uncharacterized protein n=1 Tax=Rubroshorea leprosula TaxID=152421 RepID=A0AAV5M1E1_9ROSI|nr:hypothetical protein SLEP1_g50443 [Rubroshorea leprosula]
MPITRVTLFRIADGSQEPSQDDGREVQQLHPSIDVFNDLLQGIIDPSLASLVQVIRDPAQPINMTGTSQPHEAHTEVTNGHGGSIAWPNNLAPPVVTATSTNGAPPNAADSTQDYVTMADLIALLDRERSKHGTIPFQFIRDPTYLKKILSRPHSKKYESSAFLQYDGRKGSVVEHVNKFLDAMEAHAGDKDLCLINQFARPLNATRKTAISIKAISIGKYAMKSTEKKTVAHTLAVFVRGQGQGQKKRDRDMAPPPLIPLTIEELDVLLYQWIIDGAITLPQAHREPNDDDKRNPKAIEAILSIGNEAERECLNAEANASHAYLESSNAVTFTDEDMEAPYPDHRKPFYLSAQINSVGVRRALVDTGSSLNVILLDTIIIVGIPNEESSSLHSTLLASVTVVNMPLDMFNLN